MIIKSPIKYPPIKSKLVNDSEKNFTFIVEPLAPGYGHTLGNSLRRVLLSSVPGFGITRVKINNVSHEYQSIDGVLEDALNVVLNLKQIRAKINTDDDKVTLNLKKSKKGDVFAKDFDTKGKAEIVNPDLYICRLSQDKEINIEVDLMRGVGYLSAEQIDFVNNLNPADILVDAVFSPVTNVALEVDEVRVGDKTDYDKLELSFTTDGSVEGKEVVEFMLAFIKDLFYQINSSFGIPDATTIQDTSDVDVVKVGNKNETESEDPFGGAFTPKIVAVLEKNQVTSPSELKVKVESGEVDDFPGLTKAQIAKINNYIKSL